MNKPVLSQLFEILLKDDNFKTALLLKQALHCELFEYGAERIVDKFRGDSAPFQRLEHFENGALFNHAQVGSADFSMRIWLPFSGPYIGFYMCEFFDLKDDKSPNGQAKAMLEKMGLFSEYKFEKGKYYKNIFAFPLQEENLITHIKEFKAKLNEAIKSESSLVP